MQVRLSYSSLVGINLGRWLIYESSGGNVTRVVNPIVQEGRCGPEMVFVIDPPVAVETFLQTWPEAREVIEIMSDASLSNPNVIIEPTPNDVAFTAQVVTIAAAGTPQQLPSVVVPDGRALVVASDVGNDPKKVVYVATSSANALNAAARVTLSPGNSVKLYVTNADLVWVDTNLNGQKVVIIVEQ